jgi:hypothetical protein
MGSTDTNLRKPTKKEYSLAVLRFPGNNAEHPASSGWVIAHMEKWLNDPRISRVIPLRRSDTPITMVRNLLVKEALDKGADYILMIDSDMQPDCEPDGKPFWDTSWEFMMERRAKEEAWLKDRVGVDVEGDCFKRFPPATIAAPYCGPAPNECVYVMRWKRPEGNVADARPFELTMYDRDHAASFSGIFEVAALPTGLILYDARTFKHLPPPWFDYEWADPPYNTTKASTEDIFQTRNASLIGMKQFCNWDAWAGHVKPKVVRKPRPVTIEDVPDAMADAIRRGARGDRRVVVMRSQEDLPDRERTVVVPRAPKE